MDVKRSWPAHRYLIHARLCGKKQCTRCFLINSSPRCETRLEPVQISWTPFWNSPLFMLCANGKQTLRAHGDLTLVVVKWQTIRHYRLQVIVHHHVPHGDTPDSERLGSPDSRTHCWTVEPSRFGHAKMYKCKSQARRVWGVSHWHSHPTKRKSCGDLNAHVADERMISLSCQKAPLPSFWQERSTLHSLPFRA